MDSLKNIVLNAISEHLEGVAETMIGEVPPEIGGDFAFPCFAHAKQLRKKPRELAEELAQKLRGGFIEKAEAKDGFVNIFLSPHRIADALLDEILQLGDAYGSGGHRGKLIVEHTSANPNAPLHIGHLRNSIIGDSMVRILRFAGYDVESQFFVNDMGGQLAVLASSLDGRNYKRELKESGKKPDIWLGEQYVEANRKVDPEVAKALQKNYERGGRAVKKIFDFIVDTALTGMRQTLDSYDIHIDTFVRESDFVFGGGVRDIIEQLKKTPYWFERDGASALDLTKYGIKKELILLRSDGTTLYTTRDLTYHLWKLRRGDCINVIANEQTLQQKQLRAALEVLGIRDVEKRVRHLSYELVTVPGMRMSSRTGEFISADELLEEGITRARKEINSRQLDILTKDRDHIARSVAVGAIRFNMVKITPLKPIEFKWHEALSFEGESAPYLQYSHARACRILEKAGDLGRPEPSAVEFTNEEQKLLVLLAQFPDSVKAAVSDLKPNLIANYLISLAEAFNRFYFKCPVLDSEEPVRSMRLAIVRMFRQVMANGLGLLGIEALERM